MKKSIYNNSDQKKVCKKYLKYLRNDFHEDENELERKIKGVQNLGELYTGVKNFLKEKKKENPEDIKNRRIIYEDRKNRAVTYEMLPYVLGVITLVSTIVIGAISVVMGAEIFAADYSDNIKQISDNIGESLGLFIFFMKCMGGAIILIAAVAIYDMITKYKTGRRNAFALFMINIIDEIEQEESKEQGEKEETALRLRETLERVQGSFELGGIEINQNIKSTREIYQLANIMEGKENTKEEKLRIEMEKSLSQVEKYICTMGENLGEIKKEVEEKILSQKAAHGDIEKDNLEKKVKFIEEKIEDFQKSHTEMKKIAHTVRLLGFNSLIVSERAREGGREFKVVAKEIVKLSQKSHDVSQEMEKILDSLK